MSAETSYYLKTLIKTRDCYEEAKLDMESRMKKMGLSGTKHEKMSYDALKISFADSVIDILKIMKITTK